MTNSTRHSAWRRRVHLGIVITKHGKPVAKLIPVHTDGAKLIGSLKGKITIKGDILSTGIKWDVES